MRIWIKYFLLFFTLVLPLFCYASKGEYDHLADSAINRIKRIVMLRDSLLKVKVIPYPNISIENQYKISGIISELLDRAETKSLDLFPPGRFPWSWWGIDKPDEMISRASELIKIFSKGIDPFNGKFAEPGGFVIDHCLIQDKNNHHLFYIRGTAATNWPEHPEFNFGHAVSSDLKNWKVEKPILQCVDSLWDQYQVWAPHIIKHNSLYYMFYTGVNQNYSQAICMATSTDLYQWKRYESNPVIKAPAWLHWNAGHWSDCRDPMVIKVGKKFYCYYTAARIDKETNKHEYCVGIASSENLINWNDEGYIRLEHSLSTPPESPFVVKKGDKYYMFYTNYKYGITYLESNHPVKGWNELAVDRMVIKKGVSASEIYQSKDKWYMSYISHENFSLHFFEMAELFWTKDGTVSLGKSGEF